MIERYEIYELTGVELAGEVYACCVRGDRNSAPIDPDETDRLLNDKAAIMDVLEQVHADWEADREWIGYPQLASIDWRAIQVVGSDPIPTKADSEQEGWLRAALLILSEWYVRIE